MTEVEAESSVSEPVTKNLQGMRGIAPEAKRPKPGGQQTAYFNSTDFKAGGYFRKEGRTMM